MHYWLKRDGCLCPYARTSSLIVSLLFCHHVAVSGAVPFSHHVFNYISYCIQFTVLFCIVITLPFSLLPFIFSLSPLFNLSFILVILFSTSLLVLIFLLQLSFFYISCLLFYQNKTEFTKNPINFKSSASAYNESQQLQSEFSSV